MNKNFNIELYRNQRIALDIILVLLPFTNLSHLPFSAYEYFINRRRGGVS